MSKSEAKQEGFQTGPSSALSIRSSQKLFSGTMRIFVTHFNFVRPTCLHAWLALRVNHTAGSNPSPSAINLGSLPSNSVDQPQNPQQTETFRVNDRTGDYRRDGNLRSETTFFSKASYFAVLVQF